MSPQYSDELWQPTDTQCTVCFHVLPCFIIPAALVSWAEQRRWAFLPSFPSRRFRVLTGILSTTVKQQSLILSAESKPKGFGTSCCKQAKAWHHLLSVLCLWRHILYPFTCLELLKWHTFWASSSALLSLHCQKLIHLWWGNRTAGRMLWVSFSCLHLRIWAGPSLDSGLAWALLQQMCKEHFVHHPRLPLCDRYCRITKPGTSCDTVHEGMSWVS